MKNKIEILSPGGDSNAVKAAILAGADAVYLGLKKFNARKKAENIDFQTLAELINIAHAKDVKIFITLNILMIQIEIPEALEMVSKLINMNVDAVIVQDVGFAYQLNKYFPSLEVHASTQMTTHNQLQIEFLKTLGVKQLNFSRELSKNELIPLINFSHDSDIKTEIFVHGAYCISCSGICYMSGVISANPGNRGACLQPCRRQYGTNESLDKDYLLSLKDNNAIDHAEELLEAGADTVKIEGRIKNYNYVYEVTESWRKKIDSIYESRNLDNAEIDNKLKNVFNRDFSAGYFENNISPNMFIDSPLDQSLKPIGLVNNYIAKTQTLFLNNSYPLKIDSRINIYTAENQFICGALISNILQKNSYTIKIENQLKGKILKGQNVLLLAESSENLINRIRSLKILKNKLFIKVKGELGKHLEVTFRFNDKYATVNSDSILAKAENKSLTKETLINQFSRLGDTNFEIGEVDTADLNDNLFIPIKELNIIRRSALKTFETSSQEFLFEDSNHKKGKKNKKLALLTSDPEDYKLFKTNFDHLQFYEITGSTKINDLPQNINPWIPPFIIDKEIIKITSLLAELSPKLSVSENSGIGNWLGDNKLDWIAGPQLNCTNGYSFEAYQKLANAKGAFYSTEINNHQIVSIDEPTNFDTFFTVFSPLILMTTRQCLFLKPNLCPFDKSKVDSGCLNGCDNYTKIFDEKDIPFHVLKSNGHYNRIFNDSLLYLPESIQNINADYFLLDFRNLQFNRLHNKQKLEIVNFFQEIINNNKIDKEKSRYIKSIIGNVTRGNYQRGFE